MSHTAQPRDSRPNPTEVRPIDLAEFPRFHACIARAFAQDPLPENRDIDRRVFEPERSLAIVDRSEIVGTIVSAQRHLAVPGSTIPIAALMMCTIAPTHRRRGFFRALFDRHFHEIYAANTEPVALCWPSEAAIYGRFGFAPATRRAILSGPTQRMAFTQGTDTTDLAIRQPELQAARPDIARLHDRLWASRPGYLRRPSHWWDHYLYDPPHRRHGATALRAAVCYTAAGSVAAYGLYSVTFRLTTEPDCLLTVRDVVASDPASYRATWRFLLDLDLIRRLHVEIGSPHDPLLHMLADPRSIRMTSVDGVWARLIDVPRALAARTYAKELDVVFNVRDKSCPWNEGRWRLSGGSLSAACAPTRDQPDIDLTSADLAAIYLGETSLSTLVAAGCVTELTPGAASIASAAFRSSLPPVCPDHF